LSEAEVIRVKVLTGAKEGDTVLIVADSHKLSCGVLGKLRLFIKDTYLTLDTDSLAFCWIEDFPMFELDEATGKLDFCHNPFSIVK
jgi:aspartyl-tRNA synthetase